MVYEFLQQSGRYNEEPTGKPPTETSGRLGGIFIKAMSWGSMELTPLKSPPEMRSDSRYLVLLQPWASSIWESRARE